MSASVAIPNLRNRRRTQVGFASKSGPVSRLEFRDWPLNLEAAFETRLTFPGLLGFTTSW